MEIAGFISLFLLAAIIGFYIEMKSNSEINGAVVGVLIFLLTLFAFVAGIQCVETNITTSSITTYTYQCQICEETTTQTEEPKIMICDECKEFIKESKESEDK